jgi:hypothetical protein
VGIMPEKVGIQPVFDLQVRSGFVWPFGTGKIGWTFPGMVSGVTMICRLTRQKKARQNERAKILSKKGITIFPPDAFMQLT